MVSRLLIDELRGDGERPEVVVNECKCLGPRIFTGGRLEGMEECERTDAEACGLGPECATLKGSWQWLG